jgi:hypothetical protein
MGRRSEQQVYRRVRGFFWQTFQMAKLSHFIFLGSLFTKTETNARYFLWSQYITPTSSEIGK